jgi:hypothetical protein
MDSSPSARAPRIGRSPLSVTFDPPRLCPLPGLLLLSDQALIDEATWGKGPLQHMSLSLILFCLRYHLTALFFRFVNFRVRILVPGDRVSIEQTHAATCRQGSAAAKYMAAWRTKGHPAIQVRLLVSSFPFSKFISPFFICFDLFINYLGFVSISIAYPYMLPLVVAQNNTSTLFPQILIWACYLL